MLYVEKLLEQGNLTMNRVELNLRNRFKNTKKSDEKDAACKAGGSSLMKHDAEDVSDEDTGAGDCKR